jgi:hypothetical protein
MFKRKSSRHFAERKKSKAIQSWTIAKTLYSDAEAKLKSGEMLRMVETSNFIFKFRIYNSYE